MDAMSDLRSSLERASAKYRPPRYGTFEISVAIDLVFAESPDADPELVDLLSAIRRSPSLAIFNGLMQVVPGSAARFDYRALMHWLLASAERSNAVTTVRELEAYIDSPHVQAHWVSAIEGLELERECPISDEIAMIPWRDVPSSKHKAFVEERAFDWFRRPSAAVVHKVTFPKTHVDAGAVNDQPVLQLRQDDSDTVLCAGLFGPNAPAIRASWLNLPDGMPTWGASISMGRDTGVPPTKGFPEEGYQCLPSLFHRFAHLPAADRSHLRVPMERLNMAMRRACSVDSAIDVGIALEALFLSDTDSDRTDLTYRLRLRAARLLGQSLDERHQVSTAVKDLYTMRSAAVHKGVLPGGVHGRTVDHLLAAGYDYVARALRKCITDGMPNWANLDLS